MKRIYTILLVCLSLMFIINCDYNSVNDMAATDQNKITELTENTQTNRATRVVTKSASRDSRWKQCLLDDLDKKILRKDIFWYQIQWSNGGWSSKYYPGDGDLDWKTNSDGTRRRVWSYFYDHNYRYCTFEGSIPKALTWSKIRHDSKYGVDLVGTTGGNPYSGDTLLTKKLPILAIKKENLPRPPYQIPPQGSFYYGWTRGRIKLTPPIYGFEITSLAQANKYCEETCGQGYRMAEFHDGNGGWNWFAYGNISNKSRFWLHINDQKANPWNH